MFRTARSASLLLVAALTTGCNDFTAVPAWLGTSDPEPILHADLPQAYTYGGPVLSSPQVVPVFFAGDPFQNDVEKFLEKLSGSDYWSATTGEYGVGRLRVASSIVLDEAPPASSDFSVIEPWLAAHLRSANMGWPEPSHEDIYVIFYPSCVSAPYHGEGFTGLAEAGTEDAGTATAVDGGRGASFVYAVVPECIGSNRSAALDDVPWRLSYQIIEATTDPFEVTRPAFGWVDSDHLAWTFFTGSGEDRTAGSELPDLCYLEDGTDSAPTLLDGEFTVPRSWSNLAATERRDPCVPAPDQTYFGAAPDLTETVPMQISDDLRYDTKGLRVPLHESRTVDVRLFSTQPTSEFQVSAEEIPLGDDDAPTLKFAWDRRTGNDHEFLHLTITRLKNGPLGGTQIRVTSGEKRDATWAHGWMGFIAN